MKFLILHDARGNIAACIGRPADAPSGMMAAQAGQFATEVELPPDIVDPAKPETFERLTDIIKNYRVEVKTEARLSQKRDKKREA